METKEYMFCEDCERIVERIPGKRHGDGQVDTDENPIWLLSDDIFPIFGTGPESIQGMKTGHCGCADNI